MRSNRWKNKQWRWNKRRGETGVCYWTPHMRAHTSILHVGGAGNSPIMRHWSDSTAIPGLADKTLTYRTLCYLCWDSIRLPNSRACTEWVGGVRALSYGPSGAASLHSVCLMLVSQLRGEAHCLQVWLTELNHVICLSYFFLQLRRIRLFI